MTGISYATLRKLERGENLMTDVLDNICLKLNCDLGDIAEIVPELSAENGTDALGGKGQPRDVIRNYFLNSFYTDHCSTYMVTGAGKRPGRLDV